MKKLGFFALPLLAIALVAFTVINKNSPTVSEAVSEAYTTQSTRLQQRTKNLGNTWLKSAVCGNEVVETGEECDDGNTLNSDGCSSACQDEFLACINNACTPTDTVDQQRCEVDTDCGEPGPIGDCGDGEVNYNAGEECDPSADDNQCPTNTACSRSCECVSLTNDQPFEAILEKKGR